MTQKLVYSIPIGLAYRINHNTQILLSLSIVII